MVPNLAHYTTYELTTTIAHERRLTHEQVWQLAFHDAMQSVGYLVQRGIFQKHYQRLSSPQKMG